MPVTKAEIIGYINSELENKTRHGSSEAEADGNLGFFLVSPHGYSIINDTDFQVFVDGLTATYTMDFTSGICELESIPTSGQIVSFNFNYTYWTDEQILLAINSAIGTLFPYFYVPSIVDETSAADEYEFEIDDPNVEDIEAIYYKTASATNWSKYKGYKRYETYKTGDSTMVRFYSAPGEMSMRIHTVNRPSEFSIDSTAQDLSDLGLPDRAMYPIISYACYYLLTQKLAPRVRNDVAVATQGRGTLTPYQMNQAAQAYQMRYQLQLSTSKMRPWRKM